MNTCMDAGAPEFERNLGFMTIEEQEMLNNATVAVAGAGGDGGMLAIQLARMGVGEIRLADPDPFEAQNINRQATCTTETAGVNKATAVGRYINQINPHIVTAVFTDGVTPENVDDFMDGADLLIDETEFTLPQLGVMVARKARELHIPNLQAMNVGFGTIVTSYMPNGRTFERQLGLPEDATLDDIAGREVPLKGWLPYVPPYADLSVFKKVASGEKSAPSIAPGVAVAAGAAAAEAMLHLTKDAQNHRQRPVVAPHFKIIDVMTAEARVVKHPTASHYKYLAKMVVNNTLRRNPKASY